MNKEIKSIFLKLSGRKEEHRETLSKTGNCVSSVHVCAFPSLHKLHLSSEFSQQEAYVWKHW